MKPGGNAGSRCRASAAFTLVELLVVVAIIAILAAIAVPNMLEAQVRSKVSRTKADMRTLAAALEMYRVDENRFPTYHYTSPTGEFFMGGRAGPGIYFDTSFNGNPQLTTPVAYISSMPRDVFFADDHLGPPQRRQFMYVNWQYAGERAVLDAPEFFNLATQLFAWHLISGGPTRSRVLNPPGVNYYLSLYDPTNGTISPGKLFRTAFDPIGRPIGV